MTETIWVVSKLDDMIDGKPDATLLRAFKTADEAKAYIATLPVEHLVDYDWESVEFERVERER